MTAKTMVSVLAGLIVLATSHGVAAQSVRLLGDFNAWSAYAASENGNPVCFVLSEPTSVEPSPEGYAQGYLYLTHRPSESIRNEFNVVAGVALAPDSSATVSVGSTEFDLFTQGDAAWLDDPAQSENLASAIRAGSSLVVEATTSAGILFRQTFSLSGATASSQAINSECS